jgi:hypothetical protein
MIAFHTNNGTPAVVKAGDSTPPVSIAQRFARESSGRQRERICWWPSAETALDPPGGYFTAKQAVLPPLMGAFVRG